MSKTLAIFSIFITGLTFGQKAINHNDLLKYKIDADRFDLGRLPTSSNAPCFRDYTKSNLRLQLSHSRTGSVIYESKNEKQHGLRIIPKEIKIGKENKLLQITGQITGGWESVIPGEFEIYIGHRVDTVSYVRLAPDLHAKVYYNGKRVKKPIVIDTVQAFYLKRFRKFEAYRGENDLPSSDYKEMLFDVKAEIDENSLLIFALSSRFAEIFEVGKLLNE